MNILLMLDFIQFLMTGILLHFPFFVYIVYSICYATFILIFILFYDFLCMCKYLINFYNVVICNVCKALL